MSVPEFNSDGAYSLTPLVFENSGFSGKLSATGNVVNVQVEPLRPRKLRYSPPGALWTIERMIGIEPRRVVWNVRLKADSEANLSAVESAVDDYFFLAGPCQLDDGRGRETLYAVLDSVTPIGPRLTTPTGCKIQHYRFLFSILYPQRGSGVM